MSVHEVLPHLPRPDPLRERCLAFAVLDAVFEPRLRRHTFVREWGPAGVSLAGMDNGAGDRYTIVFDPAGAFLFGFDHECEASPWRDEPPARWPGLLDGLPEPFAHYPRQPEFLFDDFFDATVCAWYEHSRPGWRCGPVDFPDPQDADGADFLFGLLTDGTAEGYASFAEGYFEVPVERAAVAFVLAGGPLSARVVERLRPGADFDSIAAEVAGLGYPVATAP